MKLFAPPVLAIVFQALLRRVPQDDMPNFMHERLERILGHWADRYVAFIAVAGHIAIYLLEVHLGYRKGSQSAFFAPC